MDNTDQTNQINQVNDFPGATPPVLSPSTTIDITPQEIKTTTTIPELPKIENNFPTMPLSDLSMTNSSSLDNPVFVAPVSMSAPVTTPMGISGTQTTTTVTTPSTDISPTPPTTSTTTSVDLPAPSQTEEPLPKSNKGLSPVLIGILTLAFLGMAGGGVFLVSQATSGQASVAPTAPESQPAAFEVVPTLEGGTMHALPTELVTTPVDCSGTPNTAPYGNQCRATITDANGNITWAPEVATPATSIP